MNTLLKLCVSGKNHRYLLHWPLGATCLLFVKPKRLCRVLCRNSPNTQGLEGVGGLEAFSSTFSSSVQSSFLYVTLKKRQNSSQWAYVQGLGDHMTISNLLCIAPDNTYHTSPYTHHTITPHYALTKTSHPHHTFFTRSQRTVHHHSFTFITARTSHLTCFSSIVSKISSRSSHTVPSALSHSTLHQNSPPSLTTFPPPLTEVSTLCRR